MTNGENVITIRMTFFQILKSDTKKMIEMKKGAGKAYSITPEYTSTRSRKCMNLNQNLDSDHFNLGIAGIKSFLPAKRVEDLVKEKLREFGLKVEDIVAVSTGGASMMKSF